MDSQETANKIRDFLNTQPIEDILGVRTVPAHANLYMSLIQVVKEGANPTGSEIRPFVLFSNTLTADEIAKFSEILNTYRTASGYLPNQVLTSTNVYVVGFSTSTTANKIVELAGEGLDIEVTEFQLSQDLADTSALDPTRQKRLLEIRQELSQTLRQLLEDND